MVTMIGLFQDKENRLPRDKVAHVLLNKLGAFPKATQLTDAQLAPLRQFLCDYYGLLLQLHAEQVVDKRKHDAMFRALKPLYTMSSKRLSLNVALKRVVQSWVNLDVANGLPLSDQKQLVDLHNKISSYFQEVSRELQRRAVSVGDVLNVAKGQGSLLSFR